MQRQPINPIISPAQFFQAAASGNIDVVRQYLAQPDVDVNAKDDLGISAVMKAIAASQEEVVIILANDPRLDLLNLCNTPENLAFSPYDYAMAVEEEDIATIINDALQARAEQLFQAIARDDVEAVKQYVKWNSGKSAAFNMRGSGLTPLLYAASRGCAEIVKLFMAEPAVDIYKGDSDFNSNVLMMAAYFGHNNVVAVVLSDVRINPAAQNALGETATDLAECQNYDEIADLINSVIPGQSHTVSTPDRRIPKTRFFKCVTLGNNEGVVLYLQQNANDPAALNARIRSKRAYTALMLACMHGNSGAVELLLNNPYVDPNLFSKDNMITALMMAAYNGDMACVKVLVSNPRVLLTCTTLDGHNAIDYARAAGHAEIAELITESFYKRRSADTVVAASGMGFINELTSLATLNLRNLSGTTPLMAAVRNNRVDLVAKLAANPLVDLLAKNKDGLTAVEIAREEGHLPVIQLIVTAMQAKHGTAVLPPSYTTAVTREEYLRAAEFGEIQTVRLYLAANTTPEAINVRHPLTGNTVLINAVAARDCILVHELLNVPGLDSEARNDDNLTAEMLAQQSGYEEIIQEFSAHQAAIVAQTSSSSSSAAPQAEEGTFSGRLTKIGFKIEDAPEEMFCPITGEFINRPVKLSTGVIVDLGTLERLDRNKDGSVSCPYSRAPINLTEVKIDEEMHKKIETFVKQKENLKKFNQKFPPRSNNGMFSRSQSSSQLRGEEKNAKPRNRSFSARF